MKKTAYMIIMILLAVTLAVPCFAEDLFAEGTDWITDKEPITIMDNLSRAEWDARSIPLFCENDMTPLIDPLTNTIYGLTTVTVAFNTDTTISTFYVYYPERNLAYLMDNVRYAYVKEPTEDKRTKYVEALTYEGETLHWGVSSKGYLVMYTKDEEGKATYRYVYKMFSRDLDEIKLTDPETGVKFAMDRASK